MANRTLTAGSGITLDESTSGQLIVRTRDYSRPDLTGTNDKDFSVLSAHGGTVVGSPATAPSIVDGALRLVSNTPGGATSMPVHVEYPAPGVPFTVTVKFRRRGYRGTYAGVYVGLRAGTSGSGVMTTTASFWQGQNPNIPASSRWQYDATPTRSVTSDDAASSLSASGGCLRIAYDGTNVVYSESPTGHPDSFVAFQSYAAATVLGGAPGRFAVGVESFAGAFAAYVEWIDVT